jgi:tetratricopeptide (TPR) repeat protein
MHYIAICFALLSALSGPAQDQGQPPAPAKPAPRIATPYEYKSAMLLRNKDYAGARELAKDVIKAEPGNLRAWNDYVLCSTRLKDYTSAIGGLNRLRELQPDNVLLLASLVTTYTYGGFTSERDAMLERIRSLAKEGRLPKGFGYVFDTFEVGNRRVEVTEFPRLMDYGENYGKYADLRSSARYFFDVYDSADEHVDHFPVQSNEADQSVWAKKHSTEAVAGTRVFSLDAYDHGSPEPTATYRFYDGEPSYKTVRDDVIQVLSGTLKRLPNDQWDRRPKPE